MSKRWLFFLILLVSAMIVGVFFVWHPHRTDPVSPSASQSMVPLTAEEQKSAEPVVQQITYHTVKLETKTPLVELIHLVGEDQLPIILALNRLDAEHVQTGMNLIIPDQPTDLLSLSPFPHDLPLASTIAKLIFISQSNQAFAAYEYGTLVRWGAVSTGAKSTPTPNKLYFTNWKGKLIKSTVNGDWIMPWYFNIDNFAGISLHEYELPGYPASHSCIRLSKTDAQWIYEWAAQWILEKNTKLANGTPVIVFGDYDYSKNSSLGASLIDEKTRQIPTETLTSELTSCLADIEASNKKRTTILESRP